MAHTGHQNVREPMFGSYLMHIFRPRADVGEPMLHYFGPRADIGADVAQFPAASRCWEPIMLYILGRESLGSRCYTIPGASQY